MSGRAVRWGAVAISGVLALTASGCSFLLSGGPPKNHRELRYFECQSSYAPPAVDTALAVVGTSFELLLLALATSDSTFGGVGAPEMRTAEQKRNGWLFTGAFALPFVVLPVSSAVYGYTRTSACVEAKEELVVRLTAAPAPAAAPTP